jgi:hypothetical protein
MEQSSREIGILIGALNNMLEKMKATVWKGEEIPSADTAFAWLQQMSPFRLEADSPPLDASDKTQQHFEAIFFINGIKLYVEQTHALTTYRGHSFLQVKNRHKFLDDITPEEYYDEMLISHIKKKFGPAVI